MKKIDLGQTIGILANLGVIAGIIFLGLELRQNNELLAAQARQAQLEARSSATTLILNNPELAQIAYTASVGEPLAPEEGYVYETYVVNQIAQMQWQYGEYAAGYIDRIPIPAWRVAAQIPRWQEIYRSINISSSSEFAQFMEDNVLSN